MENALRVIVTTSEVILTFVKRELTFHVRISEKRAQRIYHLHDILKAKDSGNSY